MADPTPFRLRFRVVLTLGAVGLALTGRFFRLAIHREQGLAGAYAILNVVGVLVFTGIGLFFCFRALATGHSSPGDVAFVGGSLATGITAFGVQALFGTPGLAEDASEE